MSKGNMLLGHARGKVGSLVFSRSNGQQIVRARAEQVKNPQTDAQMIQRILLNTISQAYSKLNAIVDHSFEGIPVGQKSMSYFMKRNLDAIRSVLANTGDLDGTPPYVSPINSNLFALNDYEVAKGTLPDVNPSVMHADGIYIAGAANTYKGVIDAYGLQRGDQLTFLIIETSDYVNSTFKYSRVILDPRNDDGTEAPLTTPFIADGTISKPSAKNEYNGVTFKVENGQMIAQGALDNVAGAMIASRQKTDGSWMRSNSKLVISEDGAIGYSVQDALDAFKSGSLDIVNPRYLNNASKGFSSQQAAARYYNIAASASPSAGGSVAGSGRFEEGSTITLNATANAGYRFQRWTENGSAVSTANPYSFTASRNRTLVAQFVQVQTVNIAASASPAAGGSVSGGGNIEQGTSCTLRATANSGYRFVAWKENDSVVSTSATYTFTASANRTLVAEFEVYVPENNFENVTINGQAFTTDVNAGASANLAGSYVGTSNPTKFGIVNNASRPSAGAWAGQVYAAVDNNAGSFSIANAPSGTTLAPAWLVALTGNASDGWTIVDSYDHNFYNSED